MEESRNGEVGRREAGEEECWERRVEEWGRQIKMRRRRDEKLLEKRKRRRKIGGGGKTDWREVKE